MKNTWEPEKNFDNKREKVCVDCGNKYLGTGSSKRCIECRDIERERTITSEYKRSHKASLNNSKDLENKVTTAEKEMSYRDSVEGNY